MTDTAGHRYNDYDELGRLARDERSIRLRARRDPTRCRLRDRDPMRTTPRAG
jgi:hypothetical protein